jgi:hypothetical protein
MFLRDVRCGPLATPDDVILYHNNRLAPRSLARPARSAARAGEEIRLCNLLGDKKIRRWLLIEELSGNERMQGACAPPIIDPVLALKI